MKIAICLLALFAATSYGAVSAVVTGVTFAGKYTNASTKAASTCAVNATFAFASITLAATDSLELWAIAQQSATALTVNDHGMYLGCTFAATAAGATCAGSFFDVTAAAAFVAGPPITFPATGITFTANATSSITVTTTTLAAAAQTSSVFLIASVAYGAFDEGWNATYRGKATADYAGVYLYYRSTATTAAAGATTLGVTVLPVNTAITAATRYTACTFTIYNASSSASSIATLGGIAYLAFF